MTENAHDRLALASTLTLNPLEAAALVTEYREVAHQRAEFQQLAQAVTAREMTVKDQERQARRKAEQVQQDLDRAEDRIETLRRDVEHHRERRAIPAGVKWQTLVEKLRDAGVTLRSDTAVDDLVTMLLTTGRGSAVPTTAKPEFCGDCSGPFTDQQWLMDGYGGHWDTCPAGVAINEAQKADADQFPVGARVRLADSDGYPYAPHGAYGDVVEARKGISRRVDVVWTGRTEPRAVLTRRLERVEQTGPDPVTVEESEDTTPRLGDTVRVRDDAGHEVCRGIVGELAPLGLNKYMLRNPRRSDSAHTSGHTGSITDYELVERAPEVEEPTA